jgi:hypothetical protein
MACHCYARRQPWFAVAADMIVGPLRSDSLLAFGKKKLCTLSRIMDIIHEYQIFLYKFEQFVVKFLYRLYETIYCIPTEPLILFGSTDVVS